MSNSSKKAIKYTVNRISSGISSPVIVVNYNYIYNNRIVE